MSVPFTFKMRETLAARLARVADMSGLAPDELIRLAVAQLVATIEAGGGLSLPDGPLNGIPQDGAPVFLPADVARSLIRAASANRIKGGVNTVVLSLVEYAAEQFEDGDYDLLLGLDREGDDDGDDHAWTPMAREGEEVAP